MSTFTFPDSNSCDTYAIAEHFISGYLAARDGLRQLGILRTERNLQGDYAEWLVSKMLGLTLYDSPVAKAADAFDKKGLQYQIKSRIVSDVAVNTSFDFADCELAFDYLVAVFFGQRFAVLGIIKVPQAVVLQLGTQTGSTFRFRWNQASAEDERVERLFWAVGGESF